MGEARKVIRPCREAAHRGHDDNLFDVGGIGDRLFALRDLRQPGIAGTWHSTVSGRGPRPFTRAAITATWHSAAVRSSLGVWNGAPRVAAACLIDAASTAAGLPDIPSRPIVASTSSACDGLKQNWAWTTSSSGGWPVTIRLCLPAPMTATEVRGSADR
jgi:hypothetical protein